MPSISLVVCVHRERDLLIRLLQASEGCYDDLVVIHDGPDHDGIRDVVTAAGGRFYARVHCGQQEPHWPFAWEQARHDWILRLDADEYPSEALAQWLRAFRVQTVVPGDVDVYRCIWPYWDGRKELTKSWPNQRIFLFAKSRVSFIGMAECAPQSDGVSAALPLVLCHRPKRPSIGFKNAIMRRQSYVWMMVIAQSLMKSPTELPNWRLAHNAWPAGWEQMRQRPVWTGIKWFLAGGYSVLRDSQRFEGRPCFAAALNCFFYLGLGVAVAIAKWRKGGRRCA